MFKVIESNGKSLVLKISDRKPSTQTNGEGEKIQIVPLPNFQNTGLCLCGMLRPKQTIEDFIKKYNAKKPTKKQL